MTSFTGTRFALQKHCTGFPSAMLLNEAKKKKKMTPSMKKKRQLETSKRIMAPRYVHVEKVSYEES